MDGQNFENENNVTIDTTECRTCTGDPRGRAR